jgi:hypothetical protein
LSYKHKFKDVTNNKGKHNFQGGGGGGKKSYQPNNAFP